MELMFNGKEMKPIYLAHHGIKGQKWGVRNGPPYPLDAVVASRSYGKAKVTAQTSITKDTYSKINDIFRKMPIEDRRLIDPDISDKPQDYYDSLESYFRKTAFNSVRGDGFLVAEKIPRNKNVDETVGVEIGVGVLSKGKGTGTKLARDLISWFNQQKEYDVMWWPVDDANIGSKRLAEKVGFIKDPLGSDYVYAIDEAKRKLGI